MNLASSPNRFVSGHGFSRAATGSLRLGLLLLSSRATRSAVATEELRDLLFSRRTRNSRSFDSRPPDPQTKRVGNAERALAQDDSKKMPGLALRMTAAWETNAHHDRT